MSNSTVNAHDSRAAGAGGWARFALVGLLIYLVLLVAAHVLRRDLDPASNFVSEYAVGPHGWLVTTSFFVLAASSGAVCVAIVCGHERRLAVWFGAILLFVWSIAVAGSGVYPTDVPGHAETSVGHIHNLLGAIAFLSVVLSLLLLSVGLRHSERSRTVNAARVGLAGVALVALIVTVTVLEPMGRAGLGQRVLLAAVLVWLGLTAGRAVGKLVR
jgi:hypothetical membrane protein